jgi:hypothetical protein
MFTGTILWRSVDANTMPATPAYVCFYGSFSRSIAHALKCTIQVCVDVRDCALCHVLAAEKDPAVTAGKRYLTVGAPFSQNRATQVIVENFPYIAHRIPPIGEDVPHYTYSSRL